MLFFFRKKKKPAIKKEKVAAHYIHKNVCKSLRELRYLDSQIKEHNIVLANSLHYNYVATLWYDKMNPKMYSFFQKLQLRDWIDCNHSIIISQKSKKKKAAKAKRFYRNIIRYEIK